MQQYRILVSLSLSADTGKLTSKNLEGMYMGNRRFITWPQQLAFSVKYNSINNNNNNNILTNNNNSQVPMNSCNSLFTNVVF